MAKVATVPPLGLGDSKKWATVPPLGLGDSKK